MMVIAALMLTISVYSQTNEVKEYRKEIIAEMATVFEETKPMFNGYTSFDDYNDQMVVTLIMVMDLDLTAKEMWIAMHDEWSPAIQEILAVYLDVNYLKVTVIDVNGKKTSYRGRIVS